MESRRSTGRKRTYVRLPGHPALRFGALALVAAVIAFVALRGGASNAKDTSDRDPRVFAGKFLSDRLRRVPRLDLARRGAEALHAVLRPGRQSYAAKARHAEPQALVPPDKRVKVDGVEFGDGFEVSITNNGYVVTLPGLKKYPPARQRRLGRGPRRLSALDIEQSDAGDVVGHLTLEYVQGKLRVATAKTPFHVKHSPRACCANRSRRFGRSALDQPPATT